MTTGGRLTVCVLFLAGLLAPAAASAEVRFEALPFPGGREIDSWAEGVSGDGSVVVGHTFRSRPRAVRWTGRNGDFRFAILSGRRSHAYAASQDGKVVVGDVGRRIFAPFPSSPFLNTKYHAVRWSRAQVDRIARGGGGSIATDVSADGKVACGSVSQGAVIWKGGGDPVLLGELPGLAAESVASGISADGSVVVGYAGDGETEAFRWTEPTGMVGLGALPGGLRSEAYAVSADGKVVVGYSEIGEEDREAFRWTEEEGMVGLGDLPGGYLLSRATAVSGDGSRILGMGNEIYYQAKPFLWDADHGLRSLTDVLTDLGIDLTSWRLESAAGISDDGTVIVGTGIVFEGGFYHRRAWRAVIPAP